MKDILRKKIKNFDVRELGPQNKIEGGVCYLNSPGTTIHFVDGKIICEEYLIKEKPIYLIDNSFTSFSQFKEKFKNLFCIILTGAGTDGSKGMLVLKKNGAFCISQDPQEAEVSSMPEAACRLKANHERNFLTEIGYSIDAFLN